MKYLIWFILVMMYLMVEIIILGTVFILNTVWNLYFPKNFWGKYHKGISSLNSQIVKDKTIWQTFKRRFNYINKTEE